MKVKTNLILIVLIIAGLFLSSCFDQPRSRRVRSSKSYEYLPYPSTSYTTERSTVPNIVPVPIGTGTQGTTVSGFSNCSIYKAHASDYQEHNSLIGYYSVCQNSQDDTEVIIKVSNALVKPQLCLIPTQHAYNYTTHVGQPVCGALPQQGTPYKFKLAKNRTGYGGAKVNGIMIMLNQTYQYGAPFNKAEYAPKAFLECMYYKEKHQNPYYCAAFNAVGNFIYHQFKN